MAKRTVFVSYHHQGDQMMVDEFSDIFSETLDVYTDRRLREPADSDDPDYLNQICRERIQYSSVTIVMVGLETGGRKFVDWEIRDTLYREHGLLGIKIPGHGNANWIPDRLKDNLPTSGTGFARYHEFPQSARDLKNMIDEAYNARKSLIDNSRPKKPSNTSR